MKKILFSVMMLLAICANAQIKAVYPDDFVDGDLLNKSVKITNPMYVIGNVSNEKAYIYTAEFMPRAAGETVADHTSEEYKEIETKNHDINMRLKVGGLATVGTPVALGTEYPSLTLKMTDYY